MKKFIQTSFFLLIVQFAFGQSVTISPTGDDIIMTKYGTLPVILGKRANGTPSAPTPVGNFQNLLYLAGRGYNGTSFTTDKATISLRATQTWTSTANGTQIAFTTTPNGTTNDIERMVIANDGNVGIGNSAPTAKLHINHLAGPTSPTLHLQSTGLSSSFIRATSTAVGSEWNNHFLNSAAAGSNLVYWENTVNSSTPLILTGLGDAIIERNTTVGGFTKLGGDGPSIKMKRLSGTFSANANTAGTPTNIVHGITDPTKIISINVLGQYSGSGGYVSNSFLTSNGYQFDYQVDGVNIIVTPKMGNSVSLVSQNIKILITYTE
jgi:hypothetical protein